jgi:hypothetical protein
MGLNIGSASVIMLFVVLSLTVLAALSLLSANSQYRVAERAADAARAYYAADTKAAEMYGRVKDGDYSGVEAFGETGLARYRYSVEINEKSSLEVILAGGAPPVIVSWRVTESGDWTPDDSLGLWQGPED